MKMELILSHMNKHIIKSSKVLSLNMRALGVCSFGKPDTLETLHLPIPELSTPDDILVQVKAVRFDGSDGMRAAGNLRFVETVKCRLSMPRKLDFMNFGGC